MGIRHFFLQDKTNQVIHIRNDNQSISRQSGSIHPIPCQHHIKSQRQPDQRSPHNRNDRSKTGQKAEKEGTRHIEYPISKQSDQPLDDGQQRNSNRIGGDDHIDLVQNVFLILVTKRQNAVNILFHLGTTDQHEIEYQYQYGHIDSKAADSSHQHLPYLRENGDSRHNIGSIKHVISGPLLNQVRDMFRRLDQLGRVQVKILQFVDKQPDSQRERYQKTKDRFQQQDYSDEATP